MDRLVVEALNNLPGFPPAQTFKLGDWLVQIATRPAVASVADLPLDGNEQGDARIVVDQTSWYVWVGESWYGTGGAGDLPDTTVIPGTYGDSANVPRVTIDSKGRVTAATAVPASNAHGARRIASSTSTNPSDFTILADASGGQVVVTLVGTDNSFFNIKKIDGSGNPVRIAPFTGTIDGEQFLDLYVRWDCISVHYEGGEWFIV